MDLFALTATLALDTSEYEKGLKDAGDAADKLGSNKNSNNGINRFGTFSKRVLDTAGKMLESAGKSALQFGKDVLQTGLDLDEVLGGVYAVTGAVDEYNQVLLRNTILEEARGSVFTAAEVAEAAYYEGLAGYSIDETVTGLRGIVKLAEAADEPMKAISDILTDVTTAFGDGADEQLHYANVMAATATSSNTDVRKMGQALKYAAPLAASLGYSIEDVAFAIGLMADNGIKGSQAGTSLRNMFSRLASDTSGALTTLEQSLGVDFFDPVTGEALSFYEILNNIRAAWGDFSQEQQRQIISLFGFSDDEITEGADAVQIMEEYTAALEEMRAEYNALETDAERAEYLRNSWFLNTDEQGRSFLESQLGISPFNNDTWSTPKDFLSILDEIEAKYSGMSDQEKLSTAYQMVGLRAMSGFLAMVNMSDEKYAELRENIENSGGAVEEMAAIRLNNLWGDVTMLNSKLDFLRNTIYYTIDDDLRRLSQEGGSAIDRITDAVSESGLLGGLQQLGVEIGNLAKDQRFKDFLSSIAEAVAPMLTTIITEIGPAVLELAISVGQSLAQGLITGFAAILQGSDNPVLKYVGDTLSDTVDLAKEWNERDLSNGAGSWTGVDLSTQPNTLYYQTMEINGVEVSGEEIQSAIDEATANGDLMVTIAGIEMNVDWAKELLKEIVYVPAEADPNELVDSLNDADDTAAKNLRSALDTALASPFNITVNALIEGLPTWAKPPEFNAKAMYPGRILRGATMFGMDAAGVPQIAGDAGAEAVVGTDSLQTMIQQSTQQAVGGMDDALLAALNRIYNAMPKGEVVLDTGALVGAISSMINATLGRAADWRGSGHA